ncbi:MAG: hypothetical protein ACI8S3_000682 [Alphaproteobacteria bacterium]|jgi:hypothetical protein
MQNDENYSDYPVPKLYPISHEAVSLPVVRDWLGWNAENNIFEKAENRESFYQIISPRLLDDGDEATPKIGTYSDVRHLRDIIPNNEARASLLQLESDFVEALTISNRNQISRRWRNEVSEAITALQNIPALEVAAFADDDVESLNALVETAKEVLRLHERAAAD